MLGEKGAPDVGAITFVIGAIPPGIGAISPAAAGQQDPLALRERRGGRRDIQRPPRDRRAVT